MAIPDAGQVQALITVKDLYDNQVRQSEDVTKALATLTTEVRVMATRVEAFSEHKAEVKTVHEDHEDRLRKLEKWKYAIPPTIGAALTSLVVALIEYLTRALGHG